MTLKSIFHVPFLERGSKTTHFVLYEISFKKTGLPFLKKSYFSFRIGPENRKKSNYRNLKYFFSVQDDLGKPGFFIW